MVRSELREWRRIKNKKASTAKENRFCGKTNTFASNITGDKIRT
jgi:hypothetical protein